MKAIIAGTRTFNNYDYLKTIINLKVEERPQITEIVSGGAKGADALGERFAAEHKIPLKIFPADWNRFGKAAGPLRNEQMALYADMLIAFWDYESQGTFHMIKTMHEKWKTVYVFSADIISKLTEW